MKTEMKTITAHIIFALAAIYMVPTLAEPMDIHQELYNLKMNVTQDMTCNTFVIAEERSEKIIPTIRCRLSLVYFALGSSTISPVASTSILSDLRRCAIKPEDSLRVTGYTCNLGSERLNQELAKQRAETVAALLRGNGFTVTEVKGGGSRNPISDDPREVFINRRVEIGLLSNKTRNKPQNKEKR